MTMSKYEISTTITSNEYTENAHKRLALLQKYDDLIAEKCSQSTVLKTLEISKPTIFRWKKRFREYGMSGLEDDTRRPLTARKPEWTIEMKKRVLKLRLNNPVYGKDKIAVLYQREYGDNIAATRVGKILTVLLKEKKISLVSDVSGIKTINHREFNKHAKRLPHGKRSSGPGDLVQIDHMSVSVPGIGLRKDFHAYCPITKIVVTHSFDDATSYTAAKFLKKVIAKMPFRIRSIQVDGGSEFMKEFEKMCKKLGIDLYVLPPYSPEKNGGVERSNGTFRYEFYALHLKFKSEIDFEEKLEKFTDHYNSVRPHKKLMLLTPCQYFGKIVERSGVSYV